MNAPANILVVYATKHGIDAGGRGGDRGDATQRLAVDVAPAGATCDVTAYSGVVLGGVRVPTTAEVSWELPEGAPSPTSEDGRPNSPRSASHTEGAHPRLWITRSLVQC